MTRLSLELLGTFAATFDGHAVSRFRSSKARALLAYLAVEANRAHSRSSLATLLWPESSEQDAYRNLRVTLHRLRRALDDIAPDAGDEILQIGGGHVQIDHSALTLDVAEFRNLLDAVSAHGHTSPDLCRVCIERLRQAASLYRGDLLAGFDLANAPLFEEWLVVEKERLQRLCLWTVSSLASVYEHQKDLTKALEFAHRELALDPYREESYRRVMRLLTLSGRRSEAIACYLDCQRVLGDELGIEPDEETIALVNRIRSGDVAPSQHSPVRLVNFPTMFTPLVGREAELHAISERLSDPGCRLLTLIGLGGVGKTRLAVEAARHIAAESEWTSARFFDGVFFISLASVDSPEFVPATLAGDLGLTPHQGTTVADQVIDFLRHKHMLLVLDNFEHLREDAVWLLSILEAAPGIEMLVTSRFPLELQAEERLMVGGLGYPSVGTDADEAMAYPAVRLFVQAGRRVQQGFRLVSADVPAVIRICELVDGRPLALEIAASWLRIYDCSEIKREIERSLEFLATELRDVPVRHRSVRTVFNHTWDLLSATQQRALASLAVFRGPFRLEAGLTVADISIVDMAALLDASLVQRRANGWYEVHELLRKFAVHQFQIPSARESFAAQAERRHCDYYLAYVAATESALLGPEPHVTVAQLRRHIDNIRGAWQWATDQGWLPILEQSLDGLGLFYELSGLFAEGLLLLDRTATQLQELTGETLSSHQLAGLLGRLLAWQAYFLNRIGRAGEAIELLFRALTYAQESTEPRIQADVRSLLGEMLPHRGDFDLAQQYQNEAIEFFRSVADDRRLAAALTRLGVTRWRRGNYGDAMVAFREALALQQELNNRLGTARVLWSMGGIAFEQHRYAEALTYAQEAGAIYEAIGDLWGTATLAGNMALLSQAQGDFASALAYNQQDLDYDLETGNRHGESVALGNRGWILLDSGRLDEALDCYQHAVDIQEALGNKWEVARHRASIAEIWVRRHEPRHALSEFQRAIPVLRDHGAVFYLIDPLLGAANLLIDLGDLAAAREFLNEAGAIAAELGLADRLLQYHILEARLDHAAGDTQCALERLREMDRQATEPQQQATVLYWRWRLGGEDDDRTAAEDLYAKLCRRIPKFDYTMRLEELRDQTTGSENLFE